MFVHTEVATVKTVTTVPPGVTTLLTLSFPANTATINTLPSISPTIQLANTPLIVSASAVTAITRITPTLGFMTGKRLGSR